MSKRRASTVVRPRSGRLDRTALELRALRGFRIVVSAARAQDVEARQIAELSASQVCALAEISARSGLTVNGLAERMALHQTTASNLVNVLVQRKAIRRARDSKDQRVVHLHATAEGRRLLDRIPTPHCGVLADALKRLRPNALQVLDAALAELVASIQRAPPTASGEPLLGG